MKPAFALASVTACLVLACRPVGDRSSIPSRTVSLDDIHRLPSSLSFAMVQDLVREGDYAWVLDQAPPFLTCVHLPSGRARRMGPEGEGPGELVGPRAVQVVQKGGESQALVWDFRSGRVSRFSPEGEFLGSARLDEDGWIRARTNLHEVSYAAPFRVRQVGDEFLAARFPQRLDRTEDVLSGALALVDSRLRLHSGLGPLKSRTARGSDDLGEWAALPFWDARDGVAAVWRPSSSAVVWIRKGGEETDSTIVPLPPDRVEGKDRERYLEWMARLELGPGFDREFLDLRALARANADRFAEVRPIVTDLRSESTDVVWVRRFGTSADPLGRGTEWIRVPSHGSVEEVRFPKEFTPLAFDPDGALGVLEMDGGSQMLARWRPPKGATHSP